MPEILFLLPGDIFLFQLVFSASDAGETDRVSAVFRPSFRSCLFDFCGEWFYALQERKDAERMAFTAGWCDLWYTSDFRGLWKQGHCRAWCGDTAGKNTGAISGKLRAAGLCGKVVPRI